MYTHTAHNGHQHLQGMDLSKVGDSLDSFGEEEGLGSSAEFDSAVEGGYGLGSSAEFDNAAEGGSPAASGLRPLSPGSGGGGLMQELQALFEHIKRFVPQEVELETKLRPFIPDYIPAVGDIDAFLKVPRPDGKQETLGLTVLDEPSPNDDSEYYEWELRQESNDAQQKRALNEPVKSIEYSAEPNAVQRQIETWIRKIGELHARSAPPNVRYTKNMPDIEGLMQEWPPQFEELLLTTQLPSAELDVSLADYARLVCGLLDIPVYGTGPPVESLHVLFTLYSEFKSNQHFAKGG